MGGFGIAMGALSLVFMKEPVRGLFAKYEAQVAKDEGRFVQKVDAGDEEPDEDADKNVVQKFVTALKDCAKNPVTRWTTIATMFRFVAMFACDYYIPAYFLSVYP